MKRNKLAGRNGKTGKEGTTEVNRKEERFGHIAEGQCTFRAATLKKKRGRFRQDTRWSRLCRLRGDMSGRKIIVRMRKVDQLLRRKGERGGSMGFMG